MKKFLTTLTLFAFAIGVHAAVLPALQVKHVTSSDTEIISWHSKLSVYPAKYLSNADLGNVTHSETPMNLHVTFNNNKKQLFLEITTLNEEVLYQVSIAPKTQIHVLDFTNWEQNIYLLKLSDGWGNYEAFEVIKMD